MKPRTTTAGLMLIAILAVGNAGAAEQVITPSPGQQAVAPDRSFSINVDYTTADPCADGLTGLGLRIHWDSSRLAIVSLESVLSNALIVQGPLETDTADADGDPATDQFVQVAWAALDGAWPPAGACAGVTLYTAHFLPLPGFSETTTIRFSASSTAAGYALSATAALVQSDSDGSPGVCEVGPVAIQDFTYAPGVYSVASEQRITTAGDVLLQNGAEVIFTAPMLRFGPGFQVAAGAQLKARSAAPACPAASSDAGSVASSATPASASASETAWSAPAAPLLVGHASSLPDWVQALLARQGVDLDRAEQVLIDSAGAWLLFETPQDILSADRNAVSDIYRVDLFSEAIVLLSRTAQGTAGSGPSRYPTADAEGEWVVYQSDADNLVAGDDNGVTDIFLHTVSFGETTRITTASAGAAAHPALDATGADLLYDQRGEDGQRQILIDGLWGEHIAVPISLARDDAGQPLDNHHPAISADGRFLAYLEAQTNGVETDCVVHLYDRGRDQRASCPQALAADPEAARPAFSADGTQVEWSLPGLDEPLILPNPWQVAPLDAGR